MRAARVNLVVETGAVFTRAFTLMVPTGTPKLAADVIVGDRFFVDGAPQRVAALVRYLDSTKFTMGKGLWYDTHVTIPNGEYVMPAAPVSFDQAVSSWWFPDLNQQMELPVSISPDGTVVAIDLTDTDTQKLQGFVGSWAWDLFVTTVDTGWMRLVEGAFTVVRGEARMAVVNPLVGVA